jgi:CubicO group peptidase (beta-lactamase class C family)
MMECRSTATSVPPGDRMAMQHGKRDRHPINMYPPRPSHLLAAITLLLSAAIPSGGAQAQSAGDSAPIARMEQRLWPAVTLAGTPDAGWSVAERMRRHGVRGTSVAVIAEGRVAWARAYGIHDRNARLPVTPTTLFQAGSLSTPVAAALATRPRAGRSTHPR